MSREWFRCASHRKLPKLTDFLPIEYAQAPAWQTANAESKSREFDEKFHILQAPTFLIRDLEEFREAAELRRDLSFAVAFIDIDDLKKLNSDYTETVVDHEALPVVMRCMEDHLYKRGYAYRQGGDEYMVLVYNTPLREAIAFVDALRRKIEGLEYRDIKEHITVSIGLVCGDGECHFTSREMEARASKAKAFAKEKGKNCIATSNTTLLAESDLYIASPS
jgi:diguanylate cyclase (GGDEF)-like protein